MIKRYYAIIVIFLAVSVDCQQQQQPKYTRPPQCVHCAQSTGAATAQPTEEGQRDSQKIKSSSDKAAEENLKNYKKEREKEKEESQALNDME